MILTYLRLLVSEESKVSNKSKPFKLSQFSTLKVSILSEFSNSNTDNVNYSKIEELNSDDENN